MSSPKCRSVEVINNPARPGSNHREVNNNTNNTINNDNNKDEEEEEVDENFEMKY